VWLGVAVLGHVTVTTVTTVAALMTAMVPASVPTAHIHATHVVVWLHRGAAI
jgi:hypothetical protein